jgi:hypothetical protein
VGCLRNHCGLRRLVGLRRDGLSCLDAQGGGRYGLSAALASLTVAVFTTYTNYSIFERQHQSTITAGPSDFACTSYNCIT